MDRQCSLVSGASSSEERMLFKRDSVFFLRYPSCLEKGTFPDWDNSSIACNALLRSGMTSFAM